MVVPNEGRAFLKVADNRWTGKQGLNGCADVARIAEICKACIGARRERPVLSAALLWAAPSRRHKYEGAKVDWDGVVAFVAPAGRTLDIQHDRVLLNADSRAFAYPILGPMLDGVLTFVSSASDEAAGQANVQISRADTPLGLARLCTGHFYLKA